MTLSPNKPGLAIVHDLKGDKTAKSRGIEDGLKCLRKKMILFLKLKAEIAKGV